MPDQVSDFDPFAGPALLASAPSTEPQREIWLAADSGVTTSLSFNESVTLTLRGEVNLAALRASFAALVARHEALRSAFSLDGLTVDVFELALPEAELIDLSGLAPDAREERFARLLADAVEHSFVLHRAPLFRVQYVRTGPAELRVVFTAHHIVCDGWATAVLIKDWGELYSAQLAERPATLSEAPRFTDYARAQLVHAGSAAHQADEQFWLGQFAQTPPVLDLPYDRARPPLKTYRSRRYDAQLDPELIRALKRVGAKQRSSLFTTLLAGWKALLFRVSGQEDLVVGIPAAGQSQAGYENLVGHCVNMLPLRTQLSAALPFSELLAHVRTRMLDAQEHQSYTFGTLIAKLPLPRDPSRLPLVSVVFNVERGLSSDALTFGELRAELRSNARSYENFDLFLNAVDLPSGIELECQYNLDLFDERTIARWLGGFEQLLRAVVANVDLPVGLLPIVTPSDQAQLLAWSEDAQRPFAQQGCVHELIEAQVGRAPERVACEFEAETLQYATLNARANQLARRLRALGATKGTLVGLCVERSPNMLVGLLGILKAGAGYVPLDPGYPLSRLALMTEDAQLAVLVTETKTHAELQLSATNVLCLDDASLSDEPTGDLPPGPESASPDDVAYVIYTSGSTGRPKGVRVPHRAVVNLLQSVALEPGLAATDVVLAVTTLSFDIAVSELILPLTVGARIVLVSRDVAADGARLLDVVRHSGVTFMDATPATYRLLLAAGWRGDNALRVICTGEALPRDLGVQLLERARSVWNGYGPTETTVWSSFYELQRPLERVLIGRPVANTRIYILDAQGKQLPIGVYGEIFIGGAGVALGYLNRPELSDERFVPDPFVSAPEARMYKTGDIGRYLSNGAIECVGRNDSQVKLRGYRIELGEIEDALGQHSAVRQAAVLLREDRPGDARLVAYLVAAAAIDDSELRQHLKRTLPDYMVPQVYVRLALLPLTPSGKIDRKALPAPDASASISTAEFVAPSTPTEQLLAELWQEALGVGRVSIHDDFFSLGGHSLLASQILARLRRDHSLVLSFRKIFEAPTIAQLAQLIDREQHESVANSSAQPVRRAETSAPLSLSQERIWFLEQMNPALRAVHNLPAAWRFDGAVNPALLQRALDAVAQRHETLRTTIALVDGQPRQLIAAAIALPIVHIDLRPEPEAERAARMAEAVQRHTLELFDLAAGPLFRSYLFRLADDQCVYFTLRHNIVWDGWSFDIFLRDLCVFYAAFERSLPPVLPELTVSYGDYVVWHHEHLLGPEIAGQIAWWQARLQGELPELLLPLDHPRPAHPQHVGRNAHVVFSQQESEALTDLARASGATLFMLVFAAFNVLLQRLSGQSEILVGTPVRARNRPEAEHLIGHFVNAVVLRTQLSPALTFRDLLLQVRETTLDAFSHEDMPLERLGLRPPVLRAFFSFQDARGRPLSLGEIPVTQIHVEPPTAANDMMFWVMETRAGLTAVINYSAELFEHASIERFLRGFGALLRAILVNPSALVGELPIAEPADLAVARSFGEPLGQLGPTLLQSIVTRAERQPEAAALVHGETRLTYAELLARSAGVAQLLAATGLGAGKHVAVFARNPLQRLAGVLGVLRAGAAFSVLDPQLPTARLRKLCDALTPDALLFAQGSEPPAGLAPQRLQFDDQTTAEPGATEFATASPTSAACVVAEFDGEGIAHASTVSLAGLSAGCAAVARALALDEHSTLALLPAAWSNVALLAALAPLAVGARSVLTQPQRWAALGPRLTVFGPAAAWWRCSAADLTGVERALIVDEVAPELAERLLNAGVQPFRLHAYAEAGLAPFVQSIDHPAQGGWLGQPQFPTRCAILDDTGVALPIGTLGPLYVRSEFAHAGAQPVGPAARGGWYATGEYARFNYQAELVPAPRVDGITTLNGERVALSEVSSALLCHPSIERAGLALKPGKTRAPQLIAYIVVRRDAAYTETELRRSLREHLPEALIPQLFVEVDQLLLNAAGGLDTTRMPAPPGADEGDYVAPRTAAERLLAQLWSDALEMPRVSLYDNFFDLGGQSLLCFQVIGQLEQATGRRISPRSLLLGTLEQVAAELPVQVCEEPSVPNAGAIAPVSPARPTQSKPATTLFKLLRGILGA